jgi:hypothetical protein
MHVGLKWTGNAEQPPGGFACCEASVKLGNPRAVYALIQLSFELR